MRRRSDKAIREKSLITMSAIWTVLGPVPPAALGREAHDRVGGRQTRLETMPYKEYLATPEWGREASSRVPEGGLPVPALQRLGIEFDSVAS